MKKISIPIWQLIIGLFMSWIGFAGLIDGIVEWREWFEKGIMQHWREIKRFLSEVIFFWLPFRIPEQVFDYLAIGAIFGRSYYLFSKSFIDDSLDKIEEFNRKATKIIEDEYRSSVSYYIDFKNRSIMQTSYKNKFPKQFSLADTPARSLLVDDMKIEAIERSGVTLEKVNKFGINLENVEKVDFRKIEHLLGIPKEEKYKKIAEAAKVLVDRSEEGYQFKFFYRTSKDRLKISIAFLIAWPLSLVLSFAIRIIWQVVDRNHMQYFKGQIIGYDNGEGFRGFGKLLKFYILTAIVIGELVDEVSFIFFLTALTFIPIVFITSKAIYQFAPSFVGS